MAKRKPAAPRAPQEEEELLDPTPTELDIEDFLLEWAPQTAVVEIYRRKEDGSMPHIKRVGMDILRADLYGYLRDKFGNGKYILQFKDANKRIVKNLTVDVEGAPALAPQGNGTGGGTFLEQLLLTMIANQRPAPPPPPLDMGALMTGLGTVLAALRPQGGDPAAMLAAMAQTWASLKPPEGGGVKQALDLISAAKDLVPGGAKEDDSWPGLIKEGVSAVASVFSARMATPPPAAGNPRPPGIPPGAVPVAQIPASIPETQPAPPNDPEEILKQWILAQLDFLKKKARAGKNPEDWVDYVLDNREEPGCAAILEAMRRGATFQHLLTFDPEIGKDPVLAGWFQEFYEDLHAEFKKAMDTGGPGGDAPDPGGDAEPRPQ